MALVLRSPPSSSSLMFGFGLWSREGVSASTVMLSGICAAGVSIIFGGKIGINVGILALLTLWLYTKS